MRTFIAVILLAAVFAARAEDAANSLPAVSDYAHWIKPWAERPVTNSVSGGAGLKVVVSVVTGEAPLSTVTNMSPVERLAAAFHINVVASEITTNGACRFYSVSNTDAKLAPARQFSADALQQLDDLLARLPDDGLTLPPAGQRVVVQVLEQDHWRVRVYDRAAAPVEIRSLLALINNPLDPAP